MFSLKNVSGAIALGLIVHYAVKYISKSVDNKNDIDNDGE